MSDAASLGRGWPARHVLCPGRGPARNLAAMGSPGAGTGDEGRPLLPGGKPGRHRSRYQAVSFRLSRFARQADGVVIVQQIIRFLKAHPESIWVRSIPGADVLHLSDDDRRTAVVV